MAYKHIEIPEDGEQITITDSGELNVPANPIIPFIEAVSYTHLRAHET